MLPQNAWEKTMDNQDDQPDSVGYKKPPRHRQFKPGRSGNPKGRPKGGKNFSTILDEELNVRVPVTENGKRKKISKQAAMIKQAVNKAISGDHKSTQMILNEARQSEELKHAGSVIAAEVSVSPEDQLVIDSIVRRIRASNPAAFNNASPADASTQEQAKAPEPKGDCE
jgi:hypothetical protein